MTEEKKVHVGKVMEAHGIRGDVYCLVFSGDVSWALSLKSISIGEKDFAIRKIKAFKRGFIASLDGVTDRNRAEELEGLAVHVPSAVFVSEDGDALYLSEILGFDVVDERLGALGKIEGFSSNGSQDLLRVGDAEIPFVKQLVVNMDFSAKKIVMQLPEGLLDINRKTDDEV